MRRNFSEKDTDYRRRMRVIVPVSVALVVSLLWITEEVPTSVLELQFGWEGPTRAIPEITLIPGVDTFEDTREESRFRATTAVDVQEEEIEVESEEPVAAHDIEQID